MISPAMYILEQWVDGLCYDGTVCSGVMVCGMLTPGLTLPYAMSTNHPQSSSVSHGPEVLYDPGCDVFSVPGDSGGL